jgi:hypothetical protein
MDNKGSTRVVCHLLKLGADLTVKSGDKSLARRAVELKNSQILALLKLRDIWRNIDAAEAEALRETAAEADMTDYTELW